MYSQADSGFITSAAGAIVSFGTLSVVTLHLHKENNEIA